MSRVIDAYCRLPGLVSLAISGIISGVLAVIGGIAGGIVGMYVYDGAKSKEGDLAAFLCAALAIGTIVFVILFSWLQKLHDKISIATPLLALLPCLVFALKVTAESCPGDDPANFHHYMRFIIAGWIAISLLGLAGILVSRQLFIRWPVPEANFTLPSTH